MTKQDDKSKEVKENAILNGLGFFYKVPLFGRVVRLRVRPPYLGTLDYISTTLLKMNIDEGKLSDNPLSEYRYVIKHNATYCAEVIAIATLRKRWKIKLFKRWMTSFLKWKLTPNRVIDLYLKILELSDLANFTNSIRLMSGATTTKPNLMEENEKA